MSANYVEIPSTIPRASVRGFSLKQLIIAVIATSAVAVLFTRAFFSRHVSIFTAMRKVPTTEFDDHHVMMPRPRSINMPRLASAHDELVGQKPIYGSSTLGSSWRQHNARHMFSHSSSFTESSQLDVQLVSRGFVPIENCEFSASVCADRVNVPHGATQLVTRLCAKGLTPAKCDCFGIKITNEAVPLVVSSVLTEDGVCVCQYLNRAPPATTGWGMTMACS